MKHPMEKLNGIGSVAVKKATGKTWREWCALLDKAGAPRKSHKEIAELLSARHKVAAWWAQMVAVGYEQARGLRVKHQKPAGFEVSVTRTIAAPVARAFEAWKDAALREKWLPRTPLAVRKATPHKSIRITWADGTSVGVNFWPKGALKCQVVPQHSKLPDADSAERMKDFWTEKLELLRAYLEGQA
ncbi:MAG: hypothetical protein HY302_02170 [Opitutae bacterium]|nr:hypothetical protein [Opitutae bacterium]